VPAARTSAGVGPAALHAASLVASLAFWAWLDRKLWFFGDEWDFLVKRGLSYPPASRRSIWFPHNEHWSTLPILLWRALYSLFHLSSYWPYLAPLLLAGALVAHLGWRIALSAGADAWVATFAAGLLAFLGAGAEDMTSAFQVSFVGSVLFGLLAFVLLAGGPARFARDALVSACLLAALMCSTVGDALVVGGAVVLVARRPAKRACAVLALPVVSYAIWFAFLGRPGVSAPNDHFGLATFTTVPSYVAFGLSAALGQSANALGAGTALLVALAAWLAWRARWALPRHPELLGLPVAATAFYVLAAVGRDQTAGAFIVVSRYVWVAMALLLPVIAVALSGRPEGALHRPLRVAAIGLLVSTALGNVGQAQAWAAGRTTVTRALRARLLAVGELLAAGVSDVSGPSASPLRLYPDLSAADIAALEAAGRLPRPRLAEGALAEGRVLLALGTWDGSRNALTAKPLFRGRFTLARATHALATPAGPSCTDFDPKSLRPPMEVWLRAPSRAGASVMVLAPPPPPGATNHLAVAAVVRGEPVPAPLRLAMPARGPGYLNDNGGAGEVALLWAVGAPLELCRLRSPKTST
jgi:hypothetical protein